MAKKSSLPKSDLPSIPITTDLRDKAGQEIKYCSSGDVVVLSADASEVPGEPKEFIWEVSGGKILETQVLNPDEAKGFTIAHWDTNGISGKQVVSVKAQRDGVNITSGKIEILVRPTFAVQQAEILSKLDSVPVSLQRANPIETKDKAFWIAVHNRTKAIRFNGSGYNDFIDKVLGQGDTSDIDAKFPQVKQQRDGLYTPIHGIGAYDLLKTATQVFLLLECGVVIDEQDRYSGEALYEPSEEASRLGRPMSFEETKSKLQDYLGGSNSLPYIERILKNAFDGMVPGGVFDGEYLESRATCPSMLELIWSYWLEEGMLVQTMNAICLRFQNRRIGSGRDPLAHMEIAPLYPINNLLWGYIQDELNLLSVKRRAYEYDHHYGLTLYGKAIPDFNPADSRSKFLEAFHNLLFTAATFYKQDDDTTVVSDAFPLLNALKEVHLILSQGAHNQFGDLPWTARVEMLMQQYILARPEMRKFLQSREMVPYKEAWMAQVDTMKSIQGWTDVSITHFQSLAEYGEELLLSIRYGDWVNVEDANQASNWARYWRPEIQGYNHAYRASTGVDLIADARDSKILALRSTQPGILLKQRLTEGSGRLLSPVENVQLSSFRDRRAARP